MKLYLSLIGIAVLLISVFNILLGTGAWYNIVITACLCAVVQFCLDGLVALAINKMPDRLFGIDNRMYYVSEAEKRFYKKIKVRSWKDKIWELGGLGGFSKARLAEPDSPEYIEKFIIECNKGVLTHRLCYPIGLLLMPFVSKPLAVTVVLPAALVNMFLNILPTLALRFNTPKLQAMLKRMKRIAKKKEEKQ